jgi:1-acyl-sn-glycerol-3-phosphate acyltransferase
MADHVIELGPRVPRWGNAVVAGICNAILRLLGWRLDMHLPDLPKFIIIAVPHTSNWDFVVGICTILLMRVRIRWWVKHTVYRWPWRHFVDWSGGIPIERAAAGGVVEQTVAAFAREQTLVLALTPEGTRSRVPQWKRGFYYVAVKAQVPIVLAYFDYRRRIVGTGPVIWPTGDYAADTAKMLEFYRTTAVARHPALYAGTA